MLRDCLMASERRRWCLVQTPEDDAEQSCRARRRSPEAGGHRGRRWRRSSRCRTCRPFCGGRTCVRRGRRRDHQGRPAGRAPPGPPAGRGREGKELPPPPVEGLPPPVEGDEGGSGRAGRGAGRGSGRSEIFSHFEILHEERVVRCALCVLRCVVSRSNDLGVDSGCSATAWLRSGRISASAGVASGAGSAGGRRALRGAEWRRPGLLRRRRTSRCRRPGPRMGTDARAAAGWCCA